jgi:hypothetical protein
MRASSRASRTLRSDYNLPAGTSVGWYASFFARREGSRLTAAPLGCFSP